jgi:methionine--tRNA ligase beta chain
MNMITFEDFKKLEIKIGKIVSAEKVENSNKLLNLKVDFGPSTGSGQVRQILAGIAKFYESESLVGKECPFVFNIEPKKMGELESQGMILCANLNGEPVLMHPDKQVPPGSPVS